MRDSVSSMSGKFELTIDNSLEADMVLADGSVVAVNKQDTSCRKSR